MRKSYPQLHADVALGTAAGRILWQPRIGCWYDDKMFTGEGLPAPYTGLTLHQVYEQLDCSARLYEFNSCFRRVEHPLVRVTTKSLNETDTEQIIHTPVGEQTIITRRSPTCRYPSTLKWEIASDDELDVAIWREENATWEWDQKQYDAWMRKVGHLGAPTMFMPRMNVQCLYIEKMGVENTIYALHDRPGPVERFFTALEENHNRLIDVINACPIEIINFGENIHATTLSPDLFLEYHLPACQRRCERLHAAGKFVSSHWDGDCGPLLPYVKETGLDGIEAITPEPQGDVALEEVKAALADEIFLIDGVPAIYFDDTYPVETLVECAERIIELFAPRLILGISDEISSTGDIERVKTVRDLVDRYNDIVTQKAKEEA
jgi:hypothetical protein